MSEISFDAETSATLERFGFDRETFEGLRGRLRTQGRSPEQNILRAKVTVPEEGDVAALPGRGTPARAALEERGLEAIGAGQVGVVFLAGGMATRFGGVVKAAAEVVDGRSFLDVKLADLGVVSGRVKGTVPAYLMASFATADAVRSWARPGARSGCRWRPSPSSCRCA
jgi:UTP--glucose-1-phosphate uridylyltransferase